jgi:hypothetical protein
MFSVIIACNQERNAEKIYEKRYNYYQSSFTFALDLSSQRTERTAGSLHIIGIAYTQIDWNIKVTGTFEQLPHSFVKQLQ